MTSQTKAPIPIHKTLEPIHPNLLWATHSSPGRGAARDHGRAQPLRQPERAARAGTQRGGTRCSPIAPSALRLWRWLAGIVLNALSGQPVPSLKGPAFAAGTAPTAQTAGYTEVLLLSSQRHSSGINLQAHRFVVFCSHVVRFLLYRWETLQKPVEAETQTMPPLVFAPSRASVFPDVPLLKARPGRLKGPPMACGPRRGHCRVTVDDTVVPVGWPFVSRPPWVGHRPSRRWRVTWSSSIRTALRQPPARLWRGERSYIVYR